MLSLVTILGLGLSLLPTSANCDSKFIRPPEIDKKQKYDFDFGKNTPYKVGDKIQIVWESSEENVELRLLQTTGLDGLNAGAPLDATRTEWEAEYDLAEWLKDDEDTTYCFQLFSGKTIAQSQFFNVSAPEPENIKTRTVVRLTTIEPEELSTTQSTADPTTEQTTEPSTTTTFTSEETDISSDSGLSQGEAAGAGVGATIGGLLIFGGVGWLLWEKRRRSREKSGVSGGPQVQPQQTQFSEAKAELPGDNGPHVSDYARSPVGLYEAP